MGIKEKKEQLEKQIMALYPESVEKVRKRTNTELGMSYYNIHQKVGRFAFAILSFLLYVPTLIELYQNSNSAAEYVKLAIVVIVLLLLEIGLSISLKNYYERYHGKNDNSKRVLVYSLALVSVVLSALSGVNAIDIIDKSEKEITTEIRDNRDTEIAEYSARLDRNMIELDKVNARISERSQSITDLAPVSVTKKGSAQIKTFQDQNTKAQDFIAKVTRQNDHLLKVIEDIRKENKNIMRNKITKAGKKELIYMVIFFILGIVAVGGLMFSYNLIHKQHKHMVQDKDLIPVLKEQLDKENAERKHIEQAERIKQKELDKYERSLENDEETTLNIVPTYEKKKHLQ